MLVRRPAPLGVPLHARRVLDAELPGQILHDLPRHCQRIVTQEPALGQGQARQHVRGASPPTAARPAASRAGPPTGSRGQLLSVGQVGPPEPLIGQVTEARGEAEAEHLVQATPHCGRRWPGRSRRWRHWRPSCRRERRIGPVRGTGHRLVQAPLRVVGSPITNQVRARRCAACPRSRAAGSRTGRCCPARSTPTWCPRCGAGRCSPTPSKNRSSSGRVGTWENLPYASACSSVRNSTGT